MRDDWKWIAVARADVIRQATSLLENYGDHHEWCRARPENQGRYAPDSAKECNCGLAMERGRLQSWVESWDAAPDVTPEERSEHDRLVTESVERMESEAANR